MKTITPQKFREIVDGEGMQKTPHVILKKLNSEGVQVQGQKEIERKNKVEYVKKRQDKNWNERASNYANKIIPTEPVIEQKAKSLNRMAPGLGDKVYGTETKSYLGETLSNVPRSGMNILKGLYQAVRHPIDTVKGLGKIAVGTGELIEENIRTHVSKKAKQAGYDVDIDTDLNDREMLAKNFYSELIKPYTSGEEFAETFKEDPLRIIGDFLTLASGGAGAVAKVGQGTSIANKASKIAKVADKANPYLAVPKLGANLVTKGASKALNKVGDLEKWMGNGIYKQFIPITEIEAGLLQKAEAFNKKLPFTTADTAIKHGIWGKQSTLGAKALELQNKLRTKQVEPLILKSIDDGVVIQKQNIKNKLLKAIDDGDIKITPDEVAKYDKQINKLFDSMPEQLNLGEAQKLKQAYLSSLPNQIFTKNKGAIKAFIKKTVGTELGNNIKSLIIDTYGKDVASVYQDYANLFTLVNLGKKARQSTGAGGPLQKLMTSGSSVGIAGNIANILVTPAGTGVGLILERMSRINKFTARHIENIRKIIGSTLDETSKGQKIQEIIKGIGLTENELQEIIDLQGGS